MFNKRTNKSVYIPFTKYLILGIVVASTRILAQSVSQKTNNYSFYGKIYDKEKNQALIGVEIFISEREIGTVSREDGSYRIDNIPEGEYDIKVRLIGYKEQDYKLKLHSDTRQDFYLESAVINLQPVLIEGERKESKNTKPLCSSPIR